MNKEYKVALEIFEGPLDLLLYLIKKDEVDIYDIPIVKITNQYLEYMELMRLLDINIAGDFLVMASTLIYIKSKMLLPPEERPVEDEDEDVLDPRLDLVRQLLEYKKYKDIAGQLNERQLLQEKVFARHVPTDIAKTPDMFLADISIFDLIGVFKQALQKVENASWPEIVEDRFTVVDKINEIKELIARDKVFSLTNLFEKMRLRSEVVAAFLALLELIRLKFVRVMQRDLFGEIIVEGIANGG